MDRNATAAVVNGKYVSKAAGFGLNLPGGLESMTMASYNLTTPTLSFEESVIAEANKRQFRLMIPSFSFICVLLTLGIPGNIFAITIFLTKLKKAVARQFILTLAVSDLISCVVAMPSELDIMTRYFDFDEDAYCRIFRFVAYFSNNVSSLTLVAIAIERHRIICTPWRRTFTPKMSRSICYINIGLGALFAVPIIFIYGTYTFNLGNYPIDETDINTQNDNNMANLTGDRGTRIHLETSTVYGKTCSINDDVVASKVPFCVLVAYIFTTVATYVLLTVLYAMIGKSLFTRRRESIVNQTQNNGRSRHRARHVTIMGFTLTLMYQICFLPCLTLLVLRLAKPGLYYSLSTGGKMVYTVLLKSYLINCSINPFIYCVFNKNVRAMFCKAKSKCRKSTEKHQYKTAENVL